MTTEVSTTTRRPVSLCPIADAPEVRSVIKAVWNGSRDERGNCALRRALTMLERDTLTRRNKEIAAHLGSAHYAGIKKAIGNMMIGFPSMRATRDEADAIVTLYATAMRGLPLWAVELACSRFTRGEVSSEEAETWVNRAFAPSAAMLHTAAKNSLRQFFEEADLIGRVLIGTVERPEVSEEERKRIAEGFSELTRSIVEKCSVSNLEHQVVSAQRRAELAARNLEQRQQEYIMAGLEPPKGDVITSLPMMLKMGWRIQDSPGGRVLVR